MHIINNIYHLIVSMELTNLYIKGSTKLGFDITFDDEIKVDELKEKIEKLKLPIEVVSSESNFQQYNTAFNVINISSLQLILLPIAYHSFKIIFNELIKLLKDYELYKFDITIEIPNDSVSKLSLEKFISLVNDSNIIKEYDLKSVKEIRKYLPNKIESLNDLSINKIINKLSSERCNNILFDFSNYSINKSVSYRLLNYFKDFSKFDLDKFYKYLNIIIIDLFNSSQNDYIDPLSNKNLTEYNDYIRSVYDIFLTLTSFSNKYPKLKLTSNLDNDIDIVTMIYPKIVTKLYDICFINKIEECSINYDSDISKVQIRDGEYKDISLSDIEIYDIDAEDSKFENCTIYDCKFENCRIEKCDLLTFANLKNSIIKDSYSSSSIEVEDSKIFGDESVFGGTLKGKKSKINGKILETTEIEDGINKENTILVTAF